ncbi:MAG: hypothetical protein HY438_01035 [DPANN group archaeon]|nr:hypothetical protein [DPANN group archaeon]
MFGGGLASQVSSNYARYFTASELKGIKGAINCLLNAAEIRDEEIILLDKYSLELSQLEMLLRLQGFGPETTEYQFTRTALIVYYERTQVRHIDDVNRVGALAILVNPQHDLRLASHVLGVDWQQAREQVGRLVVGNCILSELSPLYRCYSDASARQQASALANKNL